MCQREKQHFAEPQSADRDTTEKLDHLSFTTEFFEKFPDLCNSGWDQNLTLKIVTEVAQCFVQMLQKSARRAPKTRSKNLGDVRQKLAELHQIKVGLLEKVNFRQYDPKIQSFP